jgi:hypothetical protein
MKKLIPLLVIVLFVISFDSCKKDKGDPDYCTSSNWTTQLNDEISAMMTAAITYSSNPTTATCNSYKAAVQSYIDALKPFDNCSLWTAEQKAQFHDYLDEAEQDLQNACDE